MTGLLTRLGARLDTWGGAAKMARFRNGWPATATPQVRFHRTAKVQYRYLETGERANHCLHLRPADDH